MGEKSCKDCGTQENLKVTKGYKINLCKRCSTIRLNQYWKDSKRNCPHCEKELTKPGLRYHLKNNICVI